MKDPCLQMGGYAEMAASHFSEPILNIVSQPRVSLSTVHVAAQVKLLNCYLQIVLWFMCRHVHVYFLCSLVPSLSEVHFYPHILAVKEGDLWTFVSIEVIYVAMFQDFLESIFPENDFRSGS